jgi:hypothetical protein
LGSLDLEQRLAKQLFSDYIIIIGISGHRGMAAPQNKKKGRGIISKQRPPYFIPSSDTHFVGSSGEPQLLTKKRLIIK